MIFYDIIMYLCQLGGDGRYILDDGDVIIFLWGWDDGQNSDHQKMI